MTVPFFNVTFDDYDASLRQITTWYDGFLAKKTLKGGTTMTTQGLEDNW